jgi:hypothetical protein
MAQQTVLNKLYSYIHVAHDLGAKEVHSLTIMRLINELIELEKQQIIDAHNHGEYNSQFMDALDDTNGIEYYNKTYTK